MQNIEGAEQQDLTVDILKSFFGDKIEDSDRIEIEAIAKDVEASKD